jgi:hypothetical protein
MGSTLGFWPRSSDRSYVWGAFHNKIRLNPGCCPAQYSILYKIVASLRHQSSSSSSNWIWHFTMIRYTIYFSLNPSLPHLQLYYRWYCRFLGNSSAANAGTSLSGCLSVQCPSLDGDPSTALWWAHTDLGVRFMGIFNNNIHSYAIYLRGACFAWKWYRQGSTLTVAR